MNQRKNKKYKNMYINKFVGARFNDLKTNRDNPVGAGLVPARERGITIIALIITIIVLLILAGVTINAVIGENGIIEQTKQAKEENQKQTAKEKINFKITEIQMKTYAKNQKMPTLQEVADGFCSDDEIEYVELETKKIASLNKINVGNNKSIFTKLKQYPYEFEINSSLQLASINGVKIADVGNDSNPTNSKEIEEIKLILSQMEQELNSTKEQVSELKTSKSQMEQKITDLETSKSQIEQELNLAKEQVNNIITSLDVSTKQVLFEGKAIKGDKKTIPNISEYKYLIVYSSIDDVNGKAISVRTDIIGVEDALSGLICPVGINANSDSYYGISIKFTSSTEFYISNTLYGGSYRNPKIIKIEGIK